MTPARESLLPKFTLITLLFGAAFAAIHLMFPPQADNLFSYYGPMVAGSSVLLFLVYFRPATNAADFKGDGKSYFPLLYFVGTCFAPVWSIYVANYSFSGGLTTDFLIVN